MLDSHLIPITSPIANIDQQYISDRVRFTVLAPELIRVEVSENFLFCDDATQEIWYRDLPPCDYSMQFHKDHIVVVTSKAKFFYHRKKQKIDFVEIDGERINPYKDNMKGTRRTLDITTGKVKLGEGIMGRYGVAIIEDKSLIINAEGMVEPRRQVERDYYVFASKNHRKTLDLFFKITGRPPMLPRYALGTWWSRYYAYTQDEYVELMDKFIEKKIPITVATIDMDWHYVDVKKDLGYKKTDGRYALSVGWTGYTWNKNLFPDYRQFLKDLKSRNLAVTVNLHPAAGVRSFEEQYEAMAEEMGLKGLNGEPIEFDVTNPDFINAYFKILHKPFEKDGVDFWWIDWQQGKKTKIKGYDPLWACNHFHTLDNAKDGRRPLILSRYSGIGSHRYPVGFSGDTAMLWSCLRFQPYFTATAANVGYTTWSHDIGGHISVMGSEKDSELYLRWIQFGAFSPILRLHSTKVSMGKEPWKHPSVEALAVNAIKFRHRLIPYIYSEMFRTHLESRALCEPMYYSHPNRDMAYKSPNQYHFGSKLIVAPVINKIDKRTGKAKVKVWIPHGNHTDIFTGEVLPSGTYELERDLNSIPVFAHEGTIIPLAVNCDTNDTSNPSDLELMVIKGSGSYNLYEDAGDGQDYLKGKYAKTKFKVELKEDEMFLKIYPVEGDISLVPEKRNYTIKFFDIARYSGAEIKKNGEHAFAEAGQNNTILIYNVAPTDTIEIYLVGVK